MYSCRICSKSFSSSASHSQHELYHFCHPLPTDLHSAKDFRVNIAHKKFSCFKCNKTFFTISARARHQKRHRFSTHGSGMVSWSWSQLRRKRCIGQDKYYACELCEKVFKYRPCLVLHLQLHGLTTNLQEVLYTLHYSCVVRRQALTRHARSKMNFSQV